LGLAYYLEPAGVLLDDGFVSARTILQTHRVACNSPTEGNSIPWLL
jgi:hypothetical protein